MTKIIVGLVIIGIAALYFQSREKLAEQKTTEGTHAAAGGASPPASPPGAAGLSQVAAALTASLPAAPAPQSLPLKRIVTDTQGRALDGIVVGKASNSIGFRRTADKKEFLIPISRLSKEDQAFFQAMPDQHREELERILLDQKLAGRVARWNGDADLAAAEAKKYGLPMFTIFTGPDWCPHCKDMEQNVLNTSEFREFADRRLVLLKFLVKSNGRMEPDAKALAAKHGVDSYPFVVLSYPDGRAFYKKAGGYNDLPAYLAMLGRKLANPEEDALEQ